jgi:acyl-coenzyme A synthetase/AMP-(fatty) acid ligase
VLVSHADLLAQIASGVPVDMKVLVVPTPPEIGDAYGVPAERRSASGAETWDEFVAESVADPEPPKLSRGSMIYTSGTTGRPKGVRRLARYKVPKVVELSASLPREDSGKIFKRKLRASYWEGAGRGI